MLDMPRAAASAIGPTVDSDDLQRNRRRDGLSRPNAIAVDRSASAPVSMPSWTKAVLQDFANASRSEAVGPAPHGAPP